MKKFYALLAGGALLALTGTAALAQPLPLTDTQMDGVTAGAVGISNAVSLAIGDVTAETLTQTSTNVNTATSRFAIGQAFTQGLAASLLFQAASVSHADTAASLP